METKRLDRLRAAVVQKLSVSRRNNELKSCPSGHALESLPTLPTRSRPITPLPPNPQLDSLFFKLPPELRNQVYRLLFCDRELHVDMRYTATETLIPHSTERVQFDPDRRWRWRASTCHRHPDANVLFDKCGWGGPPPTACAEHDTPCTIGMLGFVLSCRLAYRETLPLIYITNTIHINTGALLLHTEKLLRPEMSSTIRSLVYQVTLESVLTYSEKHLGLTKGVLAYTALLTRIPKAFPGLKELRILLDDDVVKDIYPSALDGRLPPWGAPWTCTCPLFEPIEAIVGLYKGRLQQFVVIVGNKTFSQFLAYWRPPTERVGLGDDSGFQFWRSVSAYYYLEGVEGGAYTVSVLGHKQVQLGGYWVRGAPSTAFGKFP
ncbi:hypothetical protein GE09DRAFT_500333 [Coniochaeta sp. 2T2.1]|nr:hypothetical protein GE09DRAFT_500333 [Coniochaeta sp. 2T2.1]